MMFCTFVGVISAHRAKLPSQQLAASTPCSSCLCRSILHSTSCKWWSYTRRMIALHGNTALNTRPQVIPQCLLAIMVMRIMIIQSCFSRRATSSVSATSQKQSTVKQVLFRSFSYSYMFRWGVALSKGWTVPENTSLLCAWQVSHITARGQRSEQHSLCESEGNFGSHFCPFSNSMEV